jgi:hypothetical protein
MPRNPSFELFERICQELAEPEVCVLSEDDFERALIADLKRHFGETSAVIAFDRGLELLENHFSGKGSPLPFVHDRETREFRVTDPDYVGFIAFASERRSAGRDSRDFEVRAMARLARRLTGALHLIGSERTSYTRRRELVGYLQRLGFDKNCLEARDKDGGLDVLWLPPLGSVPLRPVVSLQCKNGSFNERDANHSAGRAHRTLQRHSHIRGQNHLLFVVFNDYIDERFEGRAVGWTFVPLGLSDLGELNERLEEHVL